MKTTKIIRHQVEHGEWCIGLLCSTDEITSQDQKELDAQMPVEHRLEGAVYSVFGSLGSIYISPGFSEKPQIEKVKE